MNHRNAINLICFESVANDKIALMPSEISEINSPPVYKLIDEILEKKIKKKLEGKCNANGLVIKNSIRVMSRDMGFIPKEHFNGSMVYHVSFKMTLCNPNNGVVLPCSVVGKNKMGIICNLIPYNSDDTNGKNADAVIKQFRKFPMVINIPKDIHSEEDMHYFEDIQLNQTIYIEVVGKKFEMQDRQMSVTGRLSDKHIFENQFV